MRAIVNKCITIMFMMTIILSIMHVSVLAADTKKEVVRVGYFDLGEYYKADTEGNVTSYDADFLSEISHYTNYTFEYVECSTWNNALDMLNAHKIDLIGTMQWTVDREQKYEICDASYGYSVAELAAVNGSNYIYEDYAKIADAKVGCVGGYVIKNQLENYMKDKNIKLNITTYDTQTQLDQALERGEIDLVAANAHAIHEDWKVIEKFAYAPFYFASWKGNEELTEAISAAIIKIHIYEPDYAVELIQQYFPLLVNSPYTKEELDCIKKGEIYTICFDGTTAPLVWYDKSTERMKGVLVEVCNQLTEQTGIRLKTCLRKDTNTSDDVHTVKYRTIYYDAKEDARNETGVTSAILDQEFKMYHRVGEEYKEGNSYDIAIVKNRDGLRDYLTQMYSNCTLVEYDTPAECMEQLKKGKVELSFLNSNVAEHILITQNIDQVTAIPMTNMTFGIALQFGGENAEQLAGIVDKGLRLVDEDKVNDTLVSYALTTSPNVNLFYLVKHHITMTIIICLILILMIVSFAILYTYAQVMKRQRIHIEQANHARTEFFARMSHDMRTPMNGILGMTKLSRDENNTEALKSNLSKIEESGEFMLSLINDTLDLQRLESGKLTFHMQPVEAETFFIGMINMAMETARQKKIEFETDLPRFDKKVFLVLDMVRVKQIFLNLSSNAIKFTPQGGTVRLSIARIEEIDESETYQFKVADTGIGMSREFIENHLFEAYSQEYNKEASQYAGSGLGLAITKNLVELLHGHISVESELGEGTTFTVELSFEKSDSTTVEENLHQKESLKESYIKVLSGKRILLAEDHPLNAEIVVRLLQKVGCEVTWAENGVKAVEMFQDSAEAYYQAILMDIRMPEMNGMEASQNIRQLDRADALSIPIIALSANAYDDDIKACLEAGMNEHLAKPIDTLELYAALCKYV